MKDETPALTASANGLRSYISLVPGSGIIQRFVVPCIYLVHCLVVNVRRSGLSDVEAIIYGFGCLSKMFLLITDEVLCACLHSSTLDAANGVGKQFTRKVRVRREALPIATTLRRL